MRHARYLILANLCVSFLVIELLAKEKDLPILDSYSIVIRLIGAATLCMITASAAATVYGIYRFFGRKRAIFYLTWTALNAGLGLTILLAGRP